MNGILAFVIAVAVYPGLLVAAVAAVVLGWGRQSARGVLSGGGAGHPLAALRELRSDFGREATAAAVLPAALTLASVAAVLAPLLALVLLPVPGNPLAQSLGLTGDLAVEAGLLVGLPLARLFVGWATPSPYTRLAADRGARLLGGAVLPLALAVTVIAEQLGTLGLAGVPAVPANTIAVVARIFAALAMALVLPALARAVALRVGASADAADLPGGELAEISGRDLAFFRIGEALQLVASAAFFTAAFLLPIFARLNTTGRAVVWVAGIVITCAGIGAWEGFAGDRPEGEERPPLSWWLGIPLLLALVALVAAAWAQRGV